MSKRLIKKKLGSEKLNQVYKKKWELIQRQVRPKFPKLDIRNGNWQIHLWKIIFPVYQTKSS